MLRSSLAASFRLQLSAIIFMQKRPQQGRSSGDLRRWKNALLALSTILKSTIQSSGFCREPGDVGINVRHVARRRCCASAQNTTPDAVGEYTGTCWCFGIAFAGSSVMPWLVVSCIALPLHSLHCMPLQPTTCSRSRRQYSSPASSEG